MIKKLRYGNTNTFFIRGTNGGLLVDTDYAGTLPLFFRSIKTAGIGISDISFILATHFHPDHIGLVGELQKLGIPLLLVDVQKDQVRFADRIFSRDSRLHYEPIDDHSVRMIRCAESRGFLAGLGICGEIIHTPSHSEDSISLILDSGECFVGDLEPFEYLTAYDENPALERDWECIINHDPTQIFYAHAGQRQPAADT